MVKLYKFIGYIGIFGGIIAIFLTFSIFSTGKPDTYTIGGGITAIIYGIIAFIKASYFEKLETVTEEARANTKLIIDYLNQRTENQKPAQE